MPCPQSSVPGIDARKAPEPRHEMTRREPEDTKSWGHDWDGSEHQPDDGWAAATWASQPAASASGSGEDG